MSVTGNVKASAVIRGRIHTLDVLTISAYGIAVRNGFKGTEVEWLKSLVSSPIKLVNIELPAEKWVGEGHKHSQVVEIAGVTENSQINLAPSVEQLSIFYEKDITFVTENDDGVVTIHVIGQKPQNDYVIQAHVVEVFT